MEFEDWLALREAPSAPSGAERESSASSASSLELRRRPRQFQPVLDGLPAAPRGRWREVAPQRIASARDDARAAVVEAELALLRPRLRAFEHRVLQSGKVGGKLAVRRSRDEGDLLEELMCRPLPALLHTLPAPFAKHRGHLARGCGLRAEVAELARRLSAGAPGSLGFTSSLLNDTAIVAGEVMVDLPPPTPSSSSTSPQHSYAPPRPSTTFGFRPDMTALKVPVPMAPPAAEARARAAAVESAFAGEAEELKAALRLLREEFDEGSCMLQEKHIAHAAEQKHSEALASALEELRSELRDARRASKAAAEEAAAEVASEAQRHRALELERLRRQLKELEHELADARELRSDHSEQHDLALHHARVEADDAREQLDLMRSVDRRLRVELGQVQQEVVALEGASRRLGSELEDAKHDKYELSRLCYETQAHGGQLELGLEAASAAARQAQARVETTQRELRQAWAQADDARELAEANHRWRGEVARCQADLSDARGQCQQESLWASQLLQQRDRAIADFRTEQVLVDQLRNELRGTGERVTDHHERYCEVLVALERERLDAARVRDELQAVSRERALLVQQLKDWQSCAVQAPPQRQRRTWNDDHRWSPEEQSRAAWSNGHVPVQQLQRQQQPQSSHQAFSSFQRHLEGQPPHSTATIEGGAVPSRGPPFSASVPVLRSHGNNMDVPADFGVSRGGSNGGSRSSSVSAEGAARHVGPSSVPSHEVAACAPPFAQVVRHPHGKGGDAHGGGADGPRLGHEDRCAMNKGPPHDHQDGTKPPSPGALVHSKRFLEGEQIGRVLGQGASAQPEAQLHLERHAIGIEKQLTLLNGERSLLESALLKFPANSGGRTLAERRQKREAEQRLVEIDKIVRDLRQALKQLESA